MNGVREGLAFCSSVLLADLWDLGILKTVSHECGRMLVLPTHTPAGFSSGESRDSIPYPVGDGVIGEAALLVGLHS